ncbi:P-type conjugative transfer protein TrbL [Stenotrophomonas maltophilia]|uniref:P-type conjugative transfer protein TrbL n=1 Tax=Stenotrophomonas maltophilia TaxID=40324 RepID=UPI00244B6719|nr:P-type conjugative transfer protein TrbL [Stenotrophomonas maltophilia]MDH0074143.1 P-type conjugative transfer protein TrbL [Stenotrophomonas maltophilia]MDH0333609.1 P-type conjugative transfer protein TrbL [Stenotrophomonas maltophilia]
MKIRFAFSNSNHVWEPTLLSLKAAPRFRIHWTPRNIAWAIVIGGLLLFLLIADTEAQGVPLTNASVGIFDNIQAQYMQKAVTWEKGLRSIALSLFGGLAVISIAWTFIKIALQKNDFSAFVPTMTMQILTLGFFLYLVENGTAVATMILKSFELSGQRVGNTGPITPSWVVINGFDSCFRIIEKVVDMSLSDSVSLGLPLVLCGIGLVLCFTAVAILLLVTTIESFFVLYGGIILLGFGALPWTRDIPKNYLIYAINVGVKIFVLSLVVSIGVEFSNDWPAMIVASTNDLILHNTLYLLAGGITFAAVAWKVPGIAAALTSGSVNFNASDITGMAATAGGAGAMAGAVAASVVTGGTSGLAAAAGGAIKAGAAGTSLASQQGASGVGALLKGLGHASKAAASEAGAALKAKAGLSPPSPASFDSRGRTVSNLGTRAANNINLQSQAAAEAKAGSPRPGTGAGGAGGVDPAGAQQPSSGGTNDSGTSTQAASASAPPSGNTSAPPPRGSTPPGSGGQQSNLQGDNNGRKRPSGAGPQLRPPPMPPSDAAQGGVQINIQNHDD